MYDTVYLGLGFIAIAWLLQFILMSKYRDPRISYPFVGAYVIGTALFVWEDFTTALTLETALHIVTLFGAVLVMLRLKR